MSQAQRVSSIGMASSSCPEADHAARTLSDHGYCILDRVLPEAHMEALSRDLDDRFARTPFCEGFFYGDRTKRFGGLLKRSPLARDLVMHPMITAIAETVLGPFCDRIQLNLTQAIEIHPGQPAQYPHRDQDMWRGEKGHVEYLLNVMWPLGDYTAENGATVVWPNSHRCQDAESLPEEDAIIAEMKPGQALLFLGSTLHGGGANTSQTPRRGIIVSYSLGWLKPYENMWLVYPPEIAKTFDPALAAMCGYQQHRPNLGNVEGQCPSVLLADKVPAYLGAKDELRPDQLELAAQLMALRDVA